MNIEKKASLPVDWKVEKIGVIGPGIVGMPMATMLAHARIKIGTDKPARVIVVQRKSKNSGWKVDAINQGKSVIGGIEPELDEMTRQAVQKGLLSASWQCDVLSDADVILVSIQTDKNGFGPEYGPLLEGMTDLAKALQNKPAHKKPLIVFESTLAPSTMTTIIREHFEKFGLKEGRDIWLGNSPNRVMPGRLVERVRHSDKLVAGLHPETAEMIAEIYRQIVTGGHLYLTNSMTAEVTKTLENAYRDVRIAFSTEIVRYCDEKNINFYQLRDEVNHMLSQQDEASLDPNAVPSGGLLIPMIGVGGHCLPKDGILLWWRNYQYGRDTSDSLIMNARKINDESPMKSLLQAEKAFGTMKGKLVTILGAAYRFNSEDTRNSPSLQLALLCLERNCHKLIIHDPFVKPNDQNLEKFNLQKYFTNDLKTALQDTEYIFMGTAHKYYLDHSMEFLPKAIQMKGIYDGCHAFGDDFLTTMHVPCTGIGYGKNKPSQKLIDFTLESFRLMERGVSNELKYVCEFLNEKYASDTFNRVVFEEVQRLAASCSTGCLIADPGPIDHIPSYNGFTSLLVEKAYQFQRK
jgi:UDP-N-acetyl-D-mannosaminuronic acid dehydrogenase